MVLGGGAAALILTQPASEDDTSSSSTVSIQSDPVIDREESEIASVLVENPQTSFTLLPLGSDTTTSSEEDEDSSDSESSESEEREYSEAEKILRETDVNNLSPMQAFLLLSDLVEKVK